MKLECAVKRRSENMKRIMEPQRHIEIINGTSFKGSFTPLLNYIKLFFTEKNKVRDIAQARNPQNQMKMKLKAENKLLNNSKQPDSQNDWSNILMIKKLTRIYLVEMMT